MRSVTMFLSLLLFLFAACDPGERTTPLDNGATDADTTGECPDDMAPVGTVCVDKYEASRGNATADSEGDDETVARSVAGVLPWMVNPISDVAFQKFKAACAAAGKHLCTVQEWMSACEGSEKRPYHFGDAFDREACNNVDAFCDDFCADHGLAQCNTGADCGYEYNCFHAVPTGSFPDCTAGDGLYDVNGNVWEIVDNGSGGFLIKGGAFNCAGAEDRLKCSFAASWTGLYAGFRCCRDR